MKLLTSCLSLWYTESTSPQSEIIGGTETGIVPHVSSCSSQSPSESKQLGNTLLLVQRVRLFPQNIGSEPSKSRLDPLPALRIPIDCPARSCTTREKAGLSTQEQAAKAKEGIRRGVPEA